MTPVDLPGTPDFGLSKGWWSFDLPGIRESGSQTTYALFAYQDLPPLKDPGNNFSWLMAHPAQPQSILDESQPGLAPLSDLMPHVAALLPEPFRAFSRNTALQKRVRSCTGCFLEAPDYLIRVTAPVEGWLVHFLSDAQWVLHWYMYLSAGGAHCVVVSRQAIGFREEQEPDWSWENFSIDMSSQEAWLCAPTFSAFLYRFWLENELWFAIQEHRKLTAVQRQYAEHYRLAGQG